MPKIRVAQEKSKGKRSYAEILKSLKGKALVPKGKKKGKS